MRTFAQKQKPTQQSKSVSSSTHSRAWSSQSQTVPSILHLQRTIGNQGAQRLLQANAENLKAGSTTVVSTDFGHDFCRIPIFSPSPVQTQPKLMVNTLGDIYEQEADRVAEHVMRMPAAQLQHPCAPCACGGGCPKCKNAGQSLGQTLLQTKPTQTSSSAETAAQPIAGQVLAQTGHSLDASTRNFMEPRFGRDFSNVRVHTDHRAARIAHSINARAFTLGQDIVFGAGEYHMGSHSGRKLLAHELTHVLQQSGGLVRRRSDMAAVSSSSTSIQRSSFGKNPPNGATDSLCDKRFCKQAPRSVRVYVQTRGSSAMWDHLDYQGSIEFVNDDSNMVHNIEIEPWHLVSPNKLGITPGQMRYARIRYRPKNMVELKIKIITAHSPKVVELCVCP